MHRGYQRIVCLTEETTETLYLLGEQDRIVGISGFAVRPRRAREEKPKVSVFTSAKNDEIRRLAPDLVLGFSDLQADIARDLVRAGLEVHIFNHRDVAGILAMIRTLGALVDAADKAGRLASELAGRIEACRAWSRALPRHPRIYFEEWNDPLISGIRWVSELVEIAGGIDCFPELSREPLAKNRIIADPGEVVRRAPDIIVGSWCGKKFRREEVVARPGWDATRAVREGRVFEIPSSSILQPGPAALTDGLDALRKIVESWASANDAPPPARSG